MTHIKEGEYRNCPHCKHFNALLHHGWIEKLRPHTKIFKCRDCYRIYIDAGEYWRELSCLMCRHALIAEDLSVGIPELSVGIPEHVEDCQYFEITDYEEIDGYEFILPGLCTQFELRETRPDPGANLKGDDNVHRVPVRIRQQRSGKGVCRQHGSL